MSAAPTLIDVGVDSGLVDKGPQKYFAISARVGEFDCVLLDTLNCHHCLTEEEQQSVADEFARRYKAHDELLAALELAAPRLQRLFDEYDNSKVTTLALNRVLNVLNKVRP